jgi:cell division protein FtsB
MISLKNYIVALGFIILFVLVFGSLFRNIGIYLETREDLRLTQEKELALSLKKQELEKKIERQNDSFEIEKEARKRLGLGREGEVILKLPPDEEIRRLIPEKSVEKEEKISNWMRWLTHLGVKL